MSHWGKPFRSFLRRFTWVCAGIVVVFVGLVLGNRYEQQRINAPVEGPLQLLPAAEHSKTYTLGDFRVHWNAHSKSMSIYNVEAPTHLVFATPAGQSFVGASTGTMTSTDTIGYFLLHRSRSVTYNKQVITTIQRHGSALTVSGQLVSVGGRTAPYVFTLKAMEPNQLQYTVSTPNSAVNRVYFSWASTPNEGYYGFGVQYTAFNMRGRKVPILVEEHGDGRGAQPLTLLADLSNGAGGHWYNTYAPVPHFITSTMQSMYSENTEYQAFNFTKNTLGQMEVDAPSATGIIFSGTTPTQLTEAYTSVVGRMKPLPTWTQQGLVFGAEGGTDVVLAHLKQLLHAHVPVSGLWIQDWVGQRKTSFGDQLWWNWTLNTNQYPHWNTFTQFLQSHHIHLLGYVNPFLVNTAGQPHMTNLYKIALARGYFVKNSAGKPYPFKYPGFTAYMIDLTNPHAVAWYQKIIKQQLVDHGFTGWMADFGEELPLDAVLYNGETGAEYHNQYPVAWQKLNETVLQQAGLSTSGLVFYRSGFSTSPKYASSFWLGDQMESWGNHNGLASSVTALLSSGLSGFTLEHSDIGGYTSITRFPLHYVRSPALLMRWVEVNAFTPLFRSHEGNLPALNTQIYSNPSIIAEVRRFAVIYQALAPYRAKLMQSAATTGAPLDRPLFYNYPNDPVAYTISYQEFMLGSDVLVAPVYQPHATKVRVYLPTGTWVELWTARTYSVAHGTYITVKAPIGQPAVFSRPGTLASSELQSAVHKIQSFG